MQTDRDDEVFCIQEMNSKCCELKEPLMLTVKGMIGLKTLQKVSFVCAPPRFSYTQIHTHTYTWTLCSLISL